MVSCGYPSTIPPPASAIWSIAPRSAIAVTSFRPFPDAEIRTALRNASAVAVIERTDEPAASANPLTREVKAAESNYLLYLAKREQARIQDMLDERKGPGFVGTTSTAFAMPGSSRARSQKPETSDCRRRRSG